MTTTAFSREWFTTYCQNAAANVLDKDGKIRFDYTQLKAALAACPEHQTNEIPAAIRELHSKIWELCNRKHGIADMHGDAGWTMLLTLLNIHAAYLMVSGLWKEEPVQTGGVDEYGFEIF